MLSERQGQGAEQQGPTLDQRPLRTDEEAHSPLRTGSAFLMESKQTLLQPPPGCNMLLVVLKYGHENFIFCPVPTVKIPPPRPFISYTQQVHGEMRFCLSPCTNLCEKSSLDDAVVETAEEATEPAEADITGLSQDVFSKMATYLTGELTGTSDNYKIPENMNKLTSLKYLEMKDIAVNISRNLKNLNQKYAALQPYLDQIALIEEQAAALEQAAYKLDAYSQKLEAKYMKSERP
ncbi:biogenesis of lysosome-related organelles complex 1 subunit 2-like [Trichosurus vulpecula]|uniref:biogenesis of lysosome-related organelles complex 1 subunit 2-like n=1 Tax=Trichosurus vulpecula TaxID=9337 RepID=UPI00186AF55B|nr:biogenesis of lysosome-related organelles complex 1 subunit 2-like [Trichosurus vulpecula]